MLDFREARMSDLPRLRELEQHVVEAERPFNSNIKQKGAVYYDIEQLIGNDDSYMLVGEHNGEIVATGYVQIRQSKSSLDHENHGYLGLMLVLPEFRGKGVNRTVMDLLMTWSKNKGVFDFYLDVYAQNQAAIRAYEKAGFQPSLMEMKLTR